MPISEKILFSIIIPTYNRANTISRAIKSVVGQTYSNWELIIVDDGSTDNTLEVVRSYIDDRIKYFYKDHEERSVARNFGIDKSSGLYISFLDDDDYYMPEFLSEFYITIIESKSPVAMFMCMEYTETKGNKILNKIPEFLLVNPVRLLWNIQSSIRPFAIHRDILKAEKFKTDCRFGEDFHLAIRIAVKFKFEFILKALSVNMIHSSQGTSYKFTKNLRSNAENSLFCFEHLLQSNFSIKSLIPEHEVYDLKNHIIYGFASAAMKKGDFKLFFELVKKFNIAGNKFNLVIRFISLFSRIPYFMLKNTINK